MASKPPKAKKPASTSIPAASTRPSRNETAPRQCKAGKSPATGAELALSVLDSREDQRCVAGRRESEGGNQVAPELAASNIGAVKPKKRRGPGRPFNPGQSGNPTGKGKLDIELRDLARTYTRESLERLAFWMRSDNPKASPFSADKLLDRGWGKPAQALNVKVAADREPVPAEIQAANAEAWTEYYRRQAGVGK